MNPVKQTHQLVLVGMVVSVIGGCATTPQQCDPRNENFFSNTSCLASGSYSRRQQNLQSELHREQRRNAAFRAMLTELETERYQLSHNREAREREYRQFDAAWRNVKQTLAAESAENELLKKRIAQINRDLAESQDPALVVDYARKIELIDDLKYEILLLQQELDAGVYESV